MKQTLAMIFVTALLLFSLAGCGEKKDSNTANGPSTGTTDNGAADSGKKKNNMPGDDMSGENKKDDSVTGDGMMGDDMDGDGENTTRSVDRRNAAASASDRSRYFGSDKTITHENGNLYGKTVSEPWALETEKSANAQPRAPYYQWNLERCVTGRCCRTAAAFDGENNAQLQTERKSAYLRTKCNGVPQCRERAGLPSFDLHGGRQARRRRGTDGRGAADADLFAFFYDDIPKQEVHKKEEQYAR